MKQVGRVISLTSDIIDVKFNKNELPGIGIFIWIKDKASLVVQSIISDEIVRTIVLKTSKNIIIGDEAIHSGEYLKVPVGSQIKGRILDVVGSPIDNKELPKETNYIAVNSIKHQSRTFVKVHELLETGIKIIDFFTPIFKGNKIGMFGGAGVGKTLVIKELISNTSDLANSHSIFVGIGERSREAEELTSELIDSDLLKKSTLYFSQMNEPSGSRQQVIYTALTAAEHFRDIEKTDILFFVDNIFRFLQAGSEISSTLGHVPSTVGYQPTLATEISEVQERICSSKGNAITSFQTVLVPADDLDDPAAVAIFSHLDGAIVLDRKKASDDLYPAIDILSSTSSNINPKFISKEHYDAVITTKKYLKKYDELYDLIAILGFNELSKSDQKIVHRARCLINFFTQNLHVAESFTRVPGVFVTLEEVLSSVQMIINGELDNEDPLQYLYIGKINPLKPKTVFDTKSELEVKSKK